MKLSKKIVILLFSCLIFISTAKPEQLSNIPFAGTITLEKKLDLTNLPAKVEAEKSRFQSDQYTLGQSIKNINIYDVLALKDVFAAYSPSKQEVLIAGDAAILDQKLPGNIIMTAKKTGGKWELEALGGELKEISLDTFFPGPLKDLETKLTKQIGTLPTLTKPTIELDKENKSIMLHGDLELLGFQTKTTVSMSSKKGNEGVHIEAEITNFTLKELFKNIEATINKTIGNAPANLFDQIIKLPIIDENFKIDSAQIDIKAFKKDGISIDLSAKVEQSGLFAGFYKLFKFTQSKQTSDLSLSLDFEKKDFKFSGKLESPFSIQKGPLSFDSDLDLDMAILGSKNDAYFKLNSELKISLPELLHPNKTNNVDVSVDFEATMEELKASGQLKKPITDALGIPNFDIDNTSINGSISYADRSKDPSAPIAKNLNLSGKTKIGGGTVDVNLHLGNELKDILLSANISELSLADLFAFGEALLPVKIPNSKELLPPLSIEQCTLTIAPLGGTLNGKTLPQGINFVGLIKSATTQTNANFTLNSEGFQGSIDRLSLGMFFPQELSSLKQELEDQLKILPILKTLAISLDKENKTITFTGDASLFEFDASTKVFLSTNPDDKGIKINASLENFTLETLFKNLGTFIGKNFGSAPTQLFDQVLNLPIIDKNFKIDSAQIDISAFKKEGVQINLKTQAEQSGLFAGFYKLFKFQQSKTKADLDLSLDFKTTTFKLSGQIESPFSIQKGALNFDSDLQLDMAILGKENKAYFKLNSQLDLEIPELLHPSKTNSVKIDTNLDVSTEKMIFSGKLDQPIKDALGVPQFDIDKVTLDGSIDYQERLKDPSSPISKDLKLTGETKIGSGTIDVDLHLGNELKDIILVANIDSLSTNDILQFADNLLPNIKLEDYKKLIPPLTIEKCLFTLAPLGGDINTTIDGKLETITLKKGLSVDGTLKSENDTTNASLLLNADGLKANLDEISLGMFFPQGLDDLRNSLEKQFKILPILKAVTIDFETKDKTLTANGKTELLDFEIDSHIEISKDGIKLQGGIPKFTLNKLLDDIEGFTQKEFGGTPAQAITQARNIWKQLNDQAKNLGFPLISEDLELDNTSLEVNAIKGQDVTIDFKSNVTLKEFFPMFNKYLQFKNPNEEIQLSLSANFNKLDFILNTKINSLFDLQAGPINLQPGIDLQLAILGSEKNARLSAQSGIELKFPKMFDPSKTDDLIIDIDIAADLHQFSLEGSLNKWTNVLGVPGFDIDEVKLQGIKDYKDFTSGSKSLSTFLPSTLYMEGKADMNGQTVDMGIRLSDGFKQLAFTAKPPTIKLNDVYKFGQKIIQAGIKDAGLPSVDFPALEDISPDIANLTLPHPNIVLAPTKITPPTASPSAQAILEDMIIEENTIDITPMLQAANNIIVAQNQTKSKSSTSSKALKIAGETTKQIASKTTQAAKEIENIIGKETLEKGLHFKGSATINNDPVDIDMHIGLTGLDLKVNNISLGILIPKQLSSLKKELEDELKIMPVLNNAQIKLDTKKRGQLEVSADASIFGIEGKADIGISTKGFFFDAAIPKLSLKDILDKIQSFIGKEIGQTEAKAMGTIRQAWDNLNGVAKLLGIPLIDDQIELNNTHISINLGGTKATKVVIGTKANQGKFFPIIDKLYKKGIIPITQRDQTLDLELSLDLSKMEFKLHTQADLPTSVTAGSYGLGQTIDIDLIIAQRPRLNLGLNIDMEFPQIYDRKKQDKLVFSFDLMPGIESLEASGSIKGMWHNALAIPDFDIGNLAIRYGKTWEEIAAVIASIAAGGEGIIDLILPTNAGLTGETKIGQTDINLAASFGLALDEIIFQAKIKQLSLKEIIHFGIQVINGALKAENKQMIDSSQVEDSFPTFALKDAEFYLAPTGGKIGTIQFPNSGAKFIVDTDILGKTVKLDLELGLKEIKAEGKFPSIEIPSPIKGLTLFRIGGAKGEEYLDLDLDLKGTDPFNSKIYISGDLELLGSKEEAKISIDKHGFEFYIDRNYFNLLELEGDLKFDMPHLKLNDFKLPDLTGELNAKLLGATGKMNLSIDKKGAIGDGTLTKIHIPSPIQGLPLLEITGNNGGPKANLTINKDKQEISLDGMINILGAKDSTSAKIGLDGSMTIKISGNLGNLISTDITIKTPKIETFLKPEAYADWLSKANITADLTVDIVNELEKELAKEMHNLKIPDTIINQAVNQLNINLQKGHINGSIADLMNPKKGIVMDIELLLKIQPLKINKTIKLAPTFSIKTKDSLIASIVNVLIQDIKSEASNIGGIIGKAAQETKKDIKKGASEVKKGLHKLTHPHFHKPW